MDFFDFIKNNKFIILIISIGMNILLLILSGFLLYQKLNYECICDKDNVCKEAKIENNIEDKFYVEVKGAVNTPGVYEVSSNNIINDVINLAGGFTKTAYTDNINLSRKVSSELVIYVYTKTEYKKNADALANSQKCECPTYDISNCLENNASEIVPGNNSILSENTNNTNKNNNSNEKKIININTATKEELMTLSGIGESKANIIIEYRNANGYFKSIEEIKNVSGIGDSVFEKIKDSITV